MKNELAKNIKTPDEAYEIIEAELKKLKTKEKYIPKTDLHMADIGDITILSKSDLIKTYSSIIGKEDAYKKASKEMGVKKAPNFSISGFPAKNWKEDIIYTYNNIERKENIEKLEKAKDKIKKYVSNEMALKRDIEDIKSLLIE